MQTLVTYWKFVYKQSKRLQWGCMQLLRHVEKLGLYIVQKLLKEPNTTLDCIPRNFKTILYHMYKACKQSICPTKFQMC